MSALSHIRNQSQRMIMTEDFNLKKLIGESRFDRYYRYDGSLTTPPCYETVVWTVLLDPIQISVHQLHAFKRLYDQNGNLMENKFRKVRPLNKRILFRSFYFEDMQTDKIYRILMEINHGQYLTYNVKLIVLLTSLLISLL